MPADTGHAEPAYHRSSVALGWRRGDADTHFKFSAGALYTCEDRTLGQRDAREARGDVGVEGYRAQHSNHRSYRRLQYRHGNPTARSDDATDRGTGARSARSGASTPDLNPLML